MPTITATKYGVLQNFGTDSWAATRDATTAASVQNQPNNSNAIAAKTSFSSGGKGSELQVFRSFFAFDTSSYSSGFTITNLKLQFDPTTSTSTNMAVAFVNSTAQGSRPSFSNLSTSDFDNYGSTNYGQNDEEFLWPDTNNISTMNLNSNAITAFLTGQLKIAILSFSDYDDLEPEVSGTNQQARQNFAYTPRLTFTATASGYSNTVNGVIGENISEVIDVASSDIETVIGR